MTLRDYRKEFIGSLEELYGRDEAESFFYLALEKFHNITRVGLALNDAYLDDHSYSQWENALLLLSKQVPIQYILAEAHFCGHTFKVNASVLIPRPETEELVDWISRQYEAGFSGTILDIGTGSGCIAISLAKHFPNAGVSAIDVSKDALEVAQANARRIGANIVFLQCDILETETLDQFDIIVSNPPYVRKLEKDEIRANVLENEPHLALFVDDDDPLVFYRKISRLAMQSLSGNGKLFFEINQYLASETIEMLTAEGFSPELKKDIYGNDRMICATRTVALR